MSAAEVNDRLHKEFQRRRRKLDAYEEFIKNQLQSTQFLSAPQIHDRLKEHFPDLPYVCERTVYSMVQRVRDTEDLPKIAEPVRQMAKVPDCEYGEKAQVDFGEKWLKSGKGQQVKVYFFAMALQRSRYKFIYLQNIPFTAKTVVYAHHLAFKYFGGMPKRVIYDQDKKILVNENYGDYVMTDEFARFVAAAHFEPVFCMPADPASKGLIENVVKYVKGNFIAGRTYVNITMLNEKASVIITTNKAPTEWVSILQDEVLATALLDRLLYRCDVVKLSGTSYRMENRSGFLGKPADKKEGVK